MTNLLVKENCTYELCRDDELTPIQSFYNDATIFITGTTGFLGQLLLEKLIRSCPGISTIYILVRNKKGKDVQTRVDEMLENTVFERLKNENPKFRHKIVAIAGDCSLPDLGLSSDDKRKLIDEINIIFHVAATVRFDEKLKVAAYINIRATQDIIHMAKKCQNLKSFIHVSTAYANCTSKVIEEKIYPPGFDYHKMVTLMENLPDEMFDRIAPMLIGKYPNTYAFTKQIAEDIVQKFGEGLPIGIFRPAIVISTYKEPVRGWINNIYGPTGVLTGAAVGLFRILHCDGTLNANIIPADMTVNSLIAAAWDVGERWKIENYSSKDLPIYNYENSTDKPITWFRFMDLARRYGAEIPTTKVIWYYCFFLRKNFLIYSIMTFFLHIVPAFLIDVAFLCIGKAPKMIKNYHKIHKFSSVISYFSTQHWIFKSYNVRKLFEKMCEKDKQIFFSDLSLISWEEFFNGYTKGIRIYLINDPMETLEVAKTKFKRLYFAHQTLKIVLIFLGLRLLWFLISFMFELF